jgi:SAM-dependent methyltransferase
MSKHNTNSSDTPASPNKAEDDLGMTFDPQTYWSNRLKASYDFDGVGFMSLGQSYNKWLYRVRRHSFFRTLNRHDLKSPGHVLDIGSGTGFYIDLWTEAGASHITGIDITDVAVRNLSSSYPSSTFYQHDIGEPLPNTLEANTFDIVSGMDVFFHIVDDNKFRQALHNVKRLLRPGGTFLFSDNFLHQQERRSKHIVHRPLSYVREVLNDVGLSPVSRKPVFFFMNQPVDDPSDLFKKIWWHIYGRAAKSEAHGFMVGALLYPLEIFVTAYLTESPTTELMVCVNPEEAVF